MNEVDIIASEQLMDEMAKLVADMEANLVIYTLITFAVNGIMSAAKVSSDDAHKRFVRYASNLDFRAPAANALN